jgi:hypothetical protein
LDLAVFQFRQSLVKKALCNALKIGVEGEALSAMR